MVVGIGASAGGLEALNKLFDALPADTGMAFVLVQHLDPTHKSMMVDLLASHTSMTVLEAANDMQVERNHVYVIPPGAYLTIRNGALRLTKPRERHGARMPFDFFLRSLAEDCGARAICVVLSGTRRRRQSGAEGDTRKGRLVIAQDPKDAGHEGMPRSAIMTGAVDLVLPVAEIPAALVKHGRQARHKRENAQDRRRTTAPTPGSLKSSSFCAPIPRTISPSTRRARCCARSSGEWRRRRSRTSALT